MFDTSYRSSGVENVIWNKISEDVCRSQQYLLTTWEKWAKQSIVG